MTTAVSRLTVALADRYRIQRELGQGGMATVYLAEDLKHDRKVALKVLKPELAAVIGAERFVQEIKTTAALQHPHILPLFDSGAADAFLYYVMPYIEGETLRSKLDREKQLGVDDAVRIVINVADALDYAHRHGVIHRDIKPENILLHDGRPMVADFGIALALSAAAGGRMTETGLSLGTPHYMSPEQATAEKDITARSDIYSLGSVLYEMLTGNPPHVGATAQQIIMKIVAEDARPVTQLRRSVPRNVAAAVRRAIEKLPGDRFESAAAFGAALADIHYVDPAAKAAAVPFRQNRPALLMAGVAALALLSAGWSYVRQPRSAPPRPLARLVVAVPDSERLTTSAGRRITFTPDGRAFVYVADGPRGTRLLLRSLDALESTPIAGSEGATNPAFSPDGETIAFVAFGPFAIRTIPRAGGTATTIAGGTNLVSGGGVDWGTDGWIYFDGGTGITRVRPDGSGREVVAPMKPAEAAAWPTILPNGRAVLMRVRRTGETEQQYTIEAVDLQTRVRKTVVRGLAARYDPAGYLLYVSARGELYAQRFDQDRVELHGEPVLLWSGLSVATFGAVDVAVSASGAVLYTAGDIGAGARRQVIWAGRDGTVSQVDSPAVAGLVNGVALSHDGTRIALEIRGATQTEGSDIWVKQLGGGPLSQVSRGGQNWRPSWSADDRSLLFLSDRDSTIGLFRQRADGSNAAVREVGGLDVNAEYGAAGDGRTLVFRLNRGPGGGDLFSLRPGIDTAFTPLFPGPALERAPALSPDGHWLAYASDESGNGEVYVRPFPSVDSARIQVSTAGGVWPRWNQSGRELFFRSASNDFMSARRVPGPGMRFERPVVLFNLGRMFQFTGSSWYDIAPDARRFVMIQSGVGGDARRTDRLVFVDDIRPELAKRVAR